MTDEVVEHAFDAYSRLLILSEDDVGEIGVSIAIPVFPANVVSQIFRLMFCQVFSSRPVIHVPEPAFVIGDIHGNFQDLIRILINSKLDYSHRYLFLGDYVDRGQYSIDVILLLFVLKIKYPDLFFFIRGNHEFKSVNLTYGFHDEVVQRYGTDDLYEQVHKIFNMLPLAAVLGNDILCLHGGLGPNLTKVADINSIEFPLETFESDLVADIVWSDPTEEAISYLDSQRGVGCIFGRYIVQQFLKENNLEKIVRAHQCVRHGIQRFANKLGITVFSSGNYSNKGNKAGYLYIESHSKVVISILEPIVYVKRSVAIFEDMGEPRPHVSRSLSVCFKMSLNPSPSSHRMNLNSKSPTKKIYHPQIKTSASKYLSKSVGSHGVLNSGSYLHLSLNNDMDSDDNQNDDSTTTSTPTLGGPTISLLLSDPTNI